MRDPTSLPQGAGELENELIDESTPRSRAASCCGAGPCSACRSRCSASSPACRSRRAGRSASSAPPDAPHRAHQRGRLARAAAPAVARRARPSRTSRASSSSSPTRTRVSCRGSRRRGRRQNKAKTWTFQIRRNVRFHDGTPMTADDVVATFKRLLTKDSQAQSSYKGVIAGGQEGRTTTACVQPCCAERVLPVPARAADLPGDHPAEDRTRSLPTDEAGRVDVKMNGTGPFKLKENRGAAGLRSRRTRPTGAADPRSTRWSGRSSRTRRGRRRSRAVRSTSPSRSPTRAPSRSATRRSRCGRRTTAT